ncbi:MAG: murein transglycosylase, partial [Methylophilaceae bacterium]
MKKIWLGLFCLTLFLLVGCAPNKMNMEDCKCEDQPEAKTKIEEKTQECNVVEVKEIDKDNENFIPYSQLRESGWYEVDFILNQDDLSAAWPAWINSCTTLIHQKPWKKVCSAANLLESPSSEEIQNYLKTHFTLYKSWKDDG